MRGVPETTPSQAATRIGAGEALALDVREDDEWAAGRVPGALHIPLGELVGRVDELDATRPLVVVCRSGARSAQAAAYLGAFGFAAENLAGGLEAWDAAGLPLDPPDGRIA